MFSCARLRLIFTSMCKFYEPMSDMEIKIWSLQVFFLPAAKPLPSLASVWLCEILRNIIKNLCVVRWWSVGLQDIFSVPFQYTLIFQCQSKRPRSSIWTTSVTVTTYCIFLHLYLFWTSMIYFRNQQSSNQWTKVVLHNVMLSSNCLWRRCTKSVGGVQIDIQSKITWFINQLKLKFRFMKLREPIFLYLKKNK